MSPPQPFACNWNNCNEYASGNELNMEKICDKDCAENKKDRSDKNDSMGWLEFGCADYWTWSKRHRSKEVMLIEPTSRKAFFHPNWSKGTAGIRGTRILNNGRYFWEIQVSHRVFGTSMMFGVGTSRCRLHAENFTNMLGEDEHGWGLSHKGLLWHNGVALHFTKRFTENVETRIGLLFDGIHGTLTYFKDGRCLGVAFRGFNEIRKPLYPIVTSTAAKTEMALGELRRDFNNLQDRCRAVILKNIKRREQLDKLDLPIVLVHYLADALYKEKFMAPVDNLDIYMV